MTETSRINNGVEVPASGIPWKERHEDHNNKIEEYIQNCLYRGCNADSTLYGKKVQLKAIFKRVQVTDPTHPIGYRHLLFCELLNPVLGSHYLSLIISSLQKDDLALATERKYMGDLREFCHYVLAKPHVPGGNGRSIADKYGPIVMPFTKYDLPIHAADRPRRKRYALATALRDDWLEFLRLDYLPNQPLPHMAARNYLAILLQTEIGARVGELLAIRSQGDGCDIDWVRNRVRLFGKGSPYSGKRLRWVPLTPLATEVLRTFEKIFKPMFPKTPQHEYLFLNQDGTRLTEFWYWKSFRKIVELARDAGVKVPADLKTHDLRRTYATNKLEKDPLAYRKLLKHLGHTYPSSVAPYLISTDEDVEEQQDDLIDIFVDPHIEKWGKK